MLLEGVLSLLVVFNVATGRYQLALIVLIVVVVTRVLSWCFSAPAADRSSACPSPPVVRLTRADQRRLINFVRTSPRGRGGKDHNVMIPRSGNTLEAIFRTPSESDGSDEVTTCFVLTHPWAILGGDLNNNIPGELSYALSSFGFYTCRFNFRGVGRSSGCCTWRGHGEREDLKAVVDWLCDEQGMTRIILVGYSYGSMISNSCVDLRDEIKAFVSISTPFPCYWGLSLFNCKAMLNLAQRSSKPKLFICGNQDQFTSTAQYKRYIRSFPVSLPSSMAVYLLEDVDHFWYGQEMAATGLILKFFKKRPDLIGRQLN